MTETQTKQRTGILGGSLSWKVFIGITAICALITIIALIVDTQKSMHSMFFYDPNFNDAYMDFFNCIKQGHSPRVYLDYNSIYPPLVNLAYNKLGLLIPNLELLTAAEIRETNRGITMYWVIQGGSAVLLWIGIYMNTPGMKKLRRILLATLSMISLPFLYAMERGNSVLLAVALTMIAVAWTQAEKKGKFAWKKELGLILLAVAANIKIWPALFGFLLIRRKKWLDAVRCVIYGLILFLWPMRFFEGLDTALLLEKIRFASESLTAIGLGYKINWATFVEIINRSYGMHIDGNLVSTILVTLTACCALVSRKKSGFLLGMALICAGYPAFSYNYNGLYLLLPLSVFLSGAEEKENWYTVAMTGLLTLGIAAIGIGGNRMFESISAIMWGEWQQLNLSTVVSGACVFAASVLYIGYTVFGEYRGCKRILSIDDK